MIFTWKMLEYTKQDYYNTSNSYFMQFQVRWTWPAHHRLLFVMGKKLSANVQQPVVVKQYTGGITELQHFALTLRFVAVMIWYNLEHCVWRFDCPNSFACFDTFTSRLSYNASLSCGTNVQIGCSSAGSQGTCSPERDPPDTEFVTLLVTNCTGIYMCI